MLFFCGRVLLGRLFNPLSLDGAMSKITKQSMRSKSLGALNVLDTNVFIHDPKALFAFPGLHIGLPITVIQELDHFKGESSQRGRNAREAIRSLDKLRDLGSLSKGVVLEDGTKIQVFALPKEDNIISELPFADPDNKILFTALHLQALGYEVHFVSKDLNMRVKADALGLFPQDYRNETIAEDDFYKGWISITVPAVDLKQDRPDVLYDAIDQYDLAINQFVLLQGKRYDDHYRVFRYLGNKMFKSVEQPRLPWPIQARNPQQLMAFDLLLDDSIQLVSLFGPAGTGKTFLALVAGLHKLLNEHVYKKMLIARPIVPLGKDLGYLPGDIQEKLYSWMQPVRDNMEFIMQKSQAGYQIQQASQHQERSYKKDKHVKGKKHHRDDRDHDRGRFPAMHSLDDLVAADKINLEAITYMRGRSIPYQYILIDEVQNLTPHEVKTLITRVGEGSKIILAGDPYQIDSPYLDFASNGLVVSSDRFKGQSIFGTVFLDISERSELSQLAGDLL
jgi:PhoH-like ATPase